MANINIGGRLHSTATGNVVTGADEVLYEPTGGTPKKQSDVNQETDAALADRYTKSETYSKTQLNSMITTPNQEYVTLVAESGDTLSDIFDGITGAADTTYRVGNWDGSANSGAGGYDITTYSEYAYDGTNFVHLSTKTQIGEVFDISAYHATGGTLATYTDLAAALDSNNGGGVPQSLQKGGMSVKFVHTYDNKYMQYRLMAISFSSTESDWQRVDDEPLADLVGYNLSILKNGVQESGLIYNNGTIQSSYFNHYSYEVNPGDLIFIDFYSGVDTSGISWVSLWNTNTFIKNINGGLNDTDKHNYMSVLIPENVNCIKVNLQSDGIGYIRRNIINEVNNKLKYQHLIFTNQASVQKSLGVVANSGSINYNINTSEILRVQVDSSLVYNVSSEFTSSGTQFSLIVFFNSNDEVISTLYPSVTTQVQTSQNTVKINEIINIPEGTSYFIVNSNVGSASIKTFNLKELNNDFYKQTVCTYLSLLQNKLFYALQQSFINASSYNCKCFKITEDRRYKITIPNFAIGSPGFFAVAYFDNTNSYISSEIAFKKDVYFEVSDYILTIPESATSFYINELAESPVTVTEISANEKEENKLIKVDELTPSEFYNNKLYDRQNNNLYPISAQGHTYECRGYNIVKNVLYFITNSSGGDGTRFPMVSYIDENGDFISYQFNNQEVIKAQLNIPSNAVFMWINTVDYQFEMETFVDIDNLSEYIIKKNATNDEVEEYDLNMTPIHGQSLSLAIVHATPPIHTTPIDGGFMFNSGVNQVGKTGQRTGITLLKEGSDAYVSTQVENSAWGTSENIKKLSEFNKPLLQHIQQFYSICGQDGGGIDTQFDTELYVLRTIMENLRNLVPYKKLGLPILYWIQGEYDNTAQTTIEAYKSALINGITSVENIAKDVFKQKSRIKCVTYQTSWTNEDDREHYSASLAQMELCRDSDMFAPSCPAYILIKGPNDYVHINNWGQYLLGLYQGIQFYSLVVNKRKNIGLMPIKNGASYVDNKITIRFGVECAPIRFSTDWVTQRTNYGFEVIRNGSDIIQSVQIVDVDKVEITCSSNIQAGDVVYYGMQPIKYGFHDMGHGGNLCDSQGEYITAVIDGTTVKLNNYCYCFKIEL